MRGIAISLAILLAPVTAGANSYSYNCSNGSCGSSDFPLSAFGELLTVEPRNEISLLFPYGYDDHLATVTFANSGSTTSVNGVLQIQTGAATTSKATLASRAHLRYVPGRGADIRFTAIFTEGVAGSTQTIGAFTSDLTDGYGFGYDGANFGVFRSSGGYTVHVPTGSWNVDKMDGTGPSRMTLDTTLGNVYRVVYQWLGFGKVQYQIESKNTGLFQTVHEILYANSETTTSSQNPSLQLVSDVENFGNNTNISIRSPSMGAYVQGAQGNGMVAHSSSTVQASVGQTLYPLLSVRSTTTYRGVSNRVSVIPSVLAVANEATNRAAEFRLVLNPTAFTASQFQQYGGANHSTVDVDTEATAFSGGEEVFAMFVGPGESREFNLHELHLTLYPGDTLTIGGVFDSGTNPLKAALRWEERY